MDQAVGSLIAFGAVAWLLAFIYRFVQASRRARAMEDLMRSRYGRIRSGDDGDQA